MVYKKEDLEIYQTQIQTDVGFNGFMTAVVVFFVGLLITQFNSYSLTIKIPISFLIISTFGFLYSTLIFSNAAEEVSQHKVEKFRRHTFLGYIISEYLGVYFLILSIPLVINVITNDLYLRIVTIIFSLAGLAIYQFLHFSILERHFNEKYKAFAWIIFIFGLILFLSQIKNLYFVQTSIGFILFMLIVIYLAIKQR
ncbi:MAG TPA: hypothetical protein VJJ23_05130 [Candidatus Nanoarchaeia archaeon]|nr:hypothetical protein [Candidatus Nanoarchaeia archaeon]